MRDSRSSDQRREVLGSDGFSGAAGEEAVAGEEVGHAFGVAVDEGDRAGGVAAEVDDLEFALAEAQGVAVFEEVVGRHREGGRVLGVGGGVGAEGTCHRAERLPVVGVLVGGDDGAQGRARGVGADQVGDALGVVGGVDEQRIVGRGAHQQVGVVVHRADGQLGDAQTGQRAPGGGSAGFDVAGVLLDDVHEDDSSGSPATAMCRPGHVAGAGKFTRSGGLRARSAGWGLRRSGRCRRCGR